jgi:hypothetical protein
MATRIMAMAYSFELPTLLQTLLAEVSGVYVVNKTIPPKTAGSDRSFSPVPEPKLMYQPALVPLYIVPDPEISCKLPSA